jgi:hypothetical protein
MLAPAKPLASTRYASNPNEEREEADSLPFGYAQGRNDNQKSKDKSRSRFPAGMTTRKINATATAKAKNNCNYFFSLRNLAPSGLRSRLFTTIDMAA